MRMKSKRSLIGYDSKSVRAWLLERREEHERAKRAKQSELAALREELAELLGEMETRAHMLDNDGMRRRFEHELADVFLTSVASDIAKRQKAKGEQTS